MNHVGLEWNATRLRAVLGGPEDFPLPAPLDPPGLEMPALVGLDRSTLHCGQSALKLVRQRPHQVASGFLVGLGRQERGAPAWDHLGRVFTPRDATSAIWHRLAGVVHRCAAVTVALPAYIDRPQAHLLRNLGVEARAKVAGTLLIPLAAALASYADNHWSQTVLAVDVDEAALTMSAYKALGDKTHLVDRRILPGLGLARWRTVLTAALADLCVWQIRRDPRDNPTADQCLFEQLDALIDAGQLNQAMHLAIQGSNWYQSLLIEPHVTAAICRPLAHAAVAEIESFVSRLGTDDVPQAVVLTWPAGRMPGLVPLLRSKTPSWPRPVLEDVDDSDFGENLVADGEDHDGVVVLGPDAPARAAHRFGRHLKKTNAAPDHFDAIAPLPAPQSAEAGPARLHFLGQDYFLKESSFAVGAGAGCQLRFDHSMHPAVSDRHCEIVFERRTFILLNRSREGTLVNDSPVNGSVVLRPGDRIRLGREGPMLKFLGKNAPLSHAKA